ncbi:acetyltransferase [Delitschia confertaspora ATCC 74209]|uniref:Acetyltransferase n=1 Tax=Delitschia confertaspora ATCC 74209 TaxID=1513339 RepID=A0A9P4JH33_9PLEO|nr:acetyltransferase [Delitschia confertaspora ATCC 74209]
MASDSSIIRHATREDVPAILSLIQELAAYEEASESCHATLETLTKTLSFPDSSSPTGFTPGFAKTYIITAPEGEVAGMALYFHNYSTWDAAPGIYLEDLFVKPPYRKRGYATALINKLCNEIVRMGGTRVEWSCLKWNKPSLEFYEKIGAKQKGEWVGLRVDGEALRRLAER